MLLKIFNTFKIFLQIFKFLIKFIKFVQIFTNFSQNTETFVIYSKFSTLSLKNLKIN